MKAIGPTNTPMHGQTFFCTVPSPLLPLITTHKGDKKFENPQFFLLKSRQSKDTRVIY